MSEIAERTLGYLEKEAHAWMTWLSLILNLCGKVILSQQRKLFKPTKHSWR
jgi:hypothetical protein